MQAGKRRQNQLGTHFEVESTVRMQDMNNRHRIFDEAFTLHVARLVLAGLLAIAVVAIGACAVNDWKTARMERKHE